jgi:hypothetical protein
MAWFRRHYGASPLHLLALAGCLFLGGYVALQMQHLAGGWRILVWLGGAVVGHDLLLFPLYALADRTLVTAAGFPRRRSQAVTRAVPWINHLRVPVVVSGLFLAVSFPLVLRLSPGTYAAATGLSVRPYLGRWLALTGGLFVGSALLYALRLGRVGARSRR